MKYLRLFENKVDIFKDEINWEEEELEGIYYWIYSKNGYIIFRKINIEYKEDYIYEYFNLNGKFLSRSEESFINDDLVRTLEDKLGNYPYLNNEGNVFLFTNLHDKRFKEIYKYYFKKPFLKDILKKMKSSGFIETKKIEIEKPKPKYGDWGWDEYEYRPDKYRYDKWGNTY